MRHLLEIAQTGLAAVLLHPLRSTATVACLVVVILPYVTGLALSQGLQAEAEASVRFGADLYVTGDQFGRDVPVRLSAIKQIQEIEGVHDVTPRIVGAIALGSVREPAVLVGLPADRFPAALAQVEGRFPAAGAANELLVGTELAQRLHLKVGSAIPPFYRNDQGEKVSSVVGVFRADVSLWQSRLVLTSYDTAAAIFNQHGLATDLLVNCRPGYQASVRARILRDVNLGPLDAPTSVRPRVTGRDDLAALLPAGLAHREGVFNLLWLLALVVASLVLAVTAGFGLSDRRREIGILKATGWQTDEVLLRGGIESLVLSLSAAAVSLLLAYVWLAWLNGYGIAAVFLAGTGAMPSFAIPYRLAPVPILLAFLIALALVMTGTLWSSWRAATVSPREAMR
jgi:ABC-type lipoprotein release transport system permease subunit